LSEKKKEIIVKKEKGRRGRRFSLVKKFVIVLKDDFYWRHDIFPTRHRSGGLDLDRDGPYQIEEETEEII